MSTNQSTQDPLRSKPAYYLKAGSSISVKEWKEDYPEMVRPRSGLLERPASHPQMVADLSVDAVEESIYRRTLHEHLCKEQPDAFKKYYTSVISIIYICIYYLCVVLLTVVVCRLFLPESPSEFYLQRHLVRDFLLDLHQFHAPKDVATPKFPITKSLKEKPPPAELRTFVEDFLQPKNLTRRRVTGYSPGHIRSLLDLDTFGPNHSQKVEAKRSSGILPMSPNMSRFGTATGGSRRLSGISESGASRAQSAAASMFRPSVKFAEECTPPSMLAKLDLPDDESEGSAGLKSMAVSTAKSTAFSKSAVEIAEMDDDIRKSNPTYKRLQYAKNQKRKQEVIIPLSIT